VSRANQRVAAKANLYVASQLSSVYDSDKREPGNRQEISLNNTFKESSETYQDRDKEPDLPEELCATERGGGQ
jgi:hypothetical protein